MRQNGYAEVDLNQLAFDRVTCDSEGITIPIIGSLDYVFCQNQKDGTSWRAIEIFGKWYDSEIAPKTTAEIYKKLEDYIAW